MELASFYVMLLLILMFLLKLSWPKILVKKLFNIKSKNEDFQADDVLYGGDCPIFTLFLFN